jgi:hypothetical protein
VSSSKAKKSRRLFGAAGLFALPTSNPSALGLLFMSLRERKNLVKKERAQQTQQLTFELLLKIVPFLCVLCSTPLQLVLFGVYTKTQGVVGELALE